MPAKSYDPACLTLAEYFLTDNPELAKLASELAAHLQQEIEDWIQFRASGPTKDVFCRPECIFKYCPDPDGCQVACQHVARMRTST